MKVGIFSPYFNTLGGGERYILTVAEYLLKRGATVNVFGGTLSPTTIKKRFDLNLAGAIFKKDFAFTDSLNYDLFFYFSDGSIPLSLAKKKILHF